MIPRWAHHFYAWLGGYFWLPCPVCGRMFGGHEEGGNLIESFTGGRSTCSRCPGDHITQAGLASYEAAGVTMRLNPRLAGIPVVEPRA